MANEPQMISTDIERIDIGDLEFDPLNPRLPHTLDGGNPAAVLAWMLEDASLLELMRSIAIQGYFPGEPLLVVPAGGGRSVVVEGNRRLAAVRLLVDPRTATVRKVAVREIAAEATFRPTELPCLAFASRLEIIDYLGYRHVTGVKEWEPLAKARYVQQLLTVGHAQGDDPLSTVARKIGSRRDYLIRLMGALSLYEHASDVGFYEIPGVDESSVDFSLLTLALSYASVREFTGVSADGSQVTGADSDIRDLFTWLFHESPGGGTILGESRSMGDLAAVVGTPAALTALRSGRTLAEAVLQTAAPLQVFRASVRLAKEQLQTALLQLVAVDSVTDADLAALEEIVTAARDVLAVLRSRREDSGAPAGESR